MKKIIVLLFLVSLFVISSCSTQPARQQITVFAAASLTDVFGEIAESFETVNPDVAIVLNFAGSQTLRTQLEEGARADVFASANHKHMDGVIVAGLVDAPRSQVFLTNQLVVVLPADNPAKVQNLEDLASPDLKLVLAAPEAPVGSYSLEALAKLDALYGPDYQQRVLANLVSSEENVRLVLIKVQLGEADAALVYSSDAVSAPDLQVLPIPAEYNVIAEYPIAPLKDSSQTELAQVFIDFVFSLEGQAILTRWGFTLVGS